MSSLRCRGNQTENWANSKIQFDLNEQRNDILGNAGKTLKHTKELITGVEKTPFITVQKWS